MKLKQDAQNTVVKNNRIITLVDNIQLLRELLDVGEGGAANECGGFSNHVMQCKVVCGEYMGNNKLTVNKDEFKQCLTLLYEKYTEELHTLTQV